MEKDSGKNQVKSVAQVGVAVRTSREPAGNVPGVSCVPTADGLKCWKLQQIYSRQKKERRAKREDRRCAEEQSPYLCSCFSWNLVMS